MRKLKLQMRVSLDGFAKSRRGEISFGLDDEQRDFCIANLSDVDAILLGRNTAEGLIDYWAGIAAIPKHEDNKLGQRITEIPKVVFSNHLTTNRWGNTTLVNGDFQAAIAGVKAKQGMNIMVYGGFSFAGLLIEHGLVDEYHLLVSPYAAGDGEPIFNRIKKDLLLEFKACKSFSSGVLLLNYEKGKIRGQE